MSNNPNESLKIGDQITEEQYRELRILAGGDSFDGKFHKLDKSYWFTTVSLLSDPPQRVYEVVSTFESRMQDNDTGHAFIHRQESKKFKSYYDQRRV